jgi:hypothetical protein
MNFVRSRVALVGLVVAWPFSQLVGCTATERDYDPPSGEGGDGVTGGSGNVGGASGGLKAGSGGKAGTSSGGTAGGDAGGGGDSGGGTDASGGTSSGSSGTGNGGSSGSGTGGSSGTDAGSGGSEAGTGGTGDTGGTGGTVDPGCVATGAEICNDGLDNDCDGTTDCLVGTSQFPLANGAAAGTDVAYGFEVPATGATFQCRVTHGDTPSGSFRACAGGVVESASSRTVYPFDLTVSSDPANDGYWTTEVRLRFPTGATSDVVRRTVYIHSSLVGEARCDELASTEAWVAAAAPHLPDAGAIVAVTVRNPFIQIAFEPPVNARHQVSADDGLVKWRSLRRQFDFDTTKHYLVMTRTYTSRAASGMGCYAARKRIHTLRGTSLAAGPMKYQDCQAIVFNKAGAGYCLDYVGGSIIGVNFDRASTRATWVPAGTPPAGSYTYPPNVLDAGYAPDADNLLWRKLTARIRPVAGGFMSNFSTKCDEEGCATGDTLYLPDKQYFGYWE